VIRVELAPEPGSFHEKVRQPGENALDLLAGRPPRHPRRGRPVKATKTVGNVTVPKTLEDLPYWTSCLDDLHDAYHGICAYYAFRIEKATTPQVDHFVAKRSSAPELVYEWSNFRLACGYANTCKNEHPDVLDPAAIEDGWFELDVDTLDVRARGDLPGPTKDEVEQTIVRLKLREGRALEVRRHAMEHFRSGRVDLAFLQMDHPFLAKELMRQGIRDRGALLALPSGIVDAVEPEVGPV
jgi:hypothetical protein